MCGLQSQTPRASSDYRWGALLSSSWSGTNPWSPMAIWSAICYSTTQVSPGFNVSWKCLPTNLQELYRAGKLKEWIIREHHTLNAVTNAEYSSFKKRLTIWVASSGIFRLHVWNSVLQPAIFRLHKDFTRLVRILYSHHSHVTAHSLKFNFLGEQATPFFTNMSYSL